MRAQLLATLAGILLGTGCSSGAATGTGIPSPPPGPPPPPTATSEVAVANNSFTPADITVPPNTTVTWTFNAGPHNITFQDGVGSSGNMSSGTHVRTFGGAGTTRYRCTIHSSDFTSGMTGSVLVQ